MPIHRRALLTALPAAGLAARAAAEAGDWPVRPVRIILPAPGGGGTADTLARIVAQELDKRLPQRFVVDNRGGANGNIGAQAAARSAPDGYTFLWSWAGTLATNPALYRDLPFDPVRDFDPVILIGNVPNILVVNRDLPVHDLAEFTAYARANPGRINYGSSGNGSSMHLAGELFRQETHTDLVHVPYAAPAAAMTDLMAGRLQAMFNLVTGTAGQVRAGQVRAIAMLSETRSPTLPDVPTSAELGMPGLVFGTWFGLLAPKGTPAPVIAACNAAMNAVLADPAARPRLETAGLDILGGPPERLAVLLAEELARHAALVRAAGIRID
ncbi:MAG TPA: tripartite tricarboxylate transporter substrate binding protein [Roseomonas sp.]